MFEKGSTYISSLRLHEILIAVVCDRDCFETYWFVFHKYPYQYFVPRHFVCSSMPTCGMHLVSWYEGTNGFNGSIYDIMKEGDEATVYLSRVMLSFLGDGGRN